jgi:Zn-finger domain-containing protein
VAAWTGSIILVLWYRATTETGRQGLSNVNHGLLSNEAQYQLVVVVIPQIYPRIREDPVLEIIVPTSYLQSVFKQMGEVVLEKWQAFCEVLHIKNEVCEADNSVRNEVCEADNSVRNEVCEADNSVRNEVCVSDNNSVRNGVCVSNNNS